MLSQVVINQGNFALQNRAENVVQTVVHCFSIMSGNKLIINKIIPLSQSPLGSLKHQVKNLGRILHLMFFRHSCHCKFLCLQHFLILFHDGSPRIR